MWFYFSVCSVVFVYPSLVPSVFCCRYLMKYMYKFIFKLSIFHLRVHVKFIHSIILTEIYIYVKQNYVIAFRCNLISCYTKWYVHFNNLITPKLTVFAFESQSIYLPPSSSLNFPGTFLFCQRRVRVPWGSSTYPVSLAYFSCLHTRLLFRFRITENLEL